MTSKYEDENARALESADQLSADWLTSALLHCGVLQVRPRMRSIAPFVFAFVDADWMIITGSLTKLSFCVKGGEKVVAVETQMFAVGVAMLSDLCRLTPSYEPALVAERPGVPSSLVIKFAASTDAKEITDSYGGYQQEIRFYREIAPTLATVRFGPCLYTAMSPTEQRYTLVFDDLATNASLCVKILDYQQQLATDCCMRPLHGAAAATSCNLFEI